VYLIWLAPDTTAPFMMPVFIGYMWGPALCTLILAIWWLAAGPLPFRTRLLVAALAAGIAAVAVFAADPSIRFSMGIHGVPAAVGAATLALFIPARLPRAQVITALVLGIAALLPWEVLRQKGVTGEYRMDTAFRWEPSAEEAALAYAHGNAAAPMSLTNDVLVEAGPADWPGFRGARRDGIVTGGVGDWSSAPLREVWRHPVGPAWSSVCVVGDRLYTQEQLGPDELVVCYRVTDGKLLWKHAEQDRHADRESGAGPRATPTFHSGKIYALGATGILTCLNSGDGTLVWRSDLKETAGVKVPMWGVSGSPLVVGDKVIVHPGAPEAPRLVAFDAVTGNPAWSVGAGKDGYSSPHLATLAGVPQVLIFAPDGLFGHDPATGQELWHYDWVSEGISQAVCQPLLLGGDKIVIGGGGVRMGTRCVQVARGPDGWSVQEVWQTNRFTPGFNDIVHHEGFLYGLESGRLVCIETATGKERWRGSGAYGAGQVLLVGNQLLVQAEDGHLALVKAMPDSWEEVVSREALGDKTWNHPVVANGRLFVRNGSEMACFDVSGR
jgi:outer membrane protein assembly factor BamB